MFLKALLTKSCVYRTVELSFKSTNSNLPTDLPTQTQAGLRCNLTVDMS